ncbi:MAG: hypothetical protein EOM36_04780 [Bacteroidia bacterium]|jgi:PHP family Zn ribbon phosphoesterase|nr:hypothetical protein [Bacteroidia bacterium]
MSKTIQATCWFCGRNFRIRDGRGWKYLCPKCFHFVYEILKVEERPLELRHNWSAIMRDRYAAKPQYFAPQVVERFRSTGVFKQQ